MRRSVIIVLLSAMAIVPLGPVAVAAEETARPAGHTRMTWEAHFAQANLAHDGHLTPEEAKAGYPTLSRHFRAIDIDGKGFVTENDIRAWKALERAGRHQPRQADDTLRPRNAFQLNRPDQRPLNTSTHRTVALPADTSR